MASIVELRGMSDERIEELLENAREEMFNLRFQHAGRRLTDTARIKQVRRDIAQYQTVLNMRAKAIEAAAGYEPVAEALEGKAWDATATFVYEDGGWAVTFEDEGGAEIATALVDLNVKQLRTRRERATRYAYEPVVSYAVR